MNIFPAITISDTEATIISEQLAVSAVKKFLHKLAYDIAASITLSSVRDGQTDEQYLRAVAKAQGQLEVLDTLLNFEGDSANSVNS